MSSHFYRVFNGSNTLQTPYLRVWEDCIPPYYFAARGPFEPKLKPGEVLGSMDDTNDNHLLFIGTRVGNVVLHREADKTKMGANPTRFTTVHMPVVLSLFLGDRYRSLEMITNKEVGYLLGYPADEQGFFDELPNIGLRLEAFLSSMIPAAEVKQNPANKAESTNVWNQADFDKSDGNGIPI